MQLDLIAGKTCSRCHRWHPNEAFYRDNSRRSGLSSRCRACTIDAARTWAAANPERRRQIVGRWIDQNRLLHNYKSTNGYTDDDREIIAVLLSDPCAYCGAATEHIDHIDPHGERGWPNLTAACASCNASKEQQPMLLWLAGAMRKQRRTTNAYGPAKRPRRKPPRPLSRES